MSRLKLKVSNDQEQMQNYKYTYRKENIWLSECTALSQKLATQLPKPNLISSSHIEGENSTETDTKPSNIRVVNQISSIALERAVILNYFGGKPKILVV